MDAEKVSETRIVWGALKMCRLTARDFDSPADGAVIGWWFTYPVHSARARTHIDRIDVDPSGEGRGHILSMWTNR
eukprot:1191853-Prorocentrum_minimum.AAC.1